MKRSRGRGRRQQNPVNRSYDSNGPDVRVRGTASQVYEKYQTLARDAMSAGDRVMSENYLQHAEHYYRIVLSHQPPQAEQTQMAENEDEAATEVETEEGAATPLVLSRGGEEGEQEAAEKPSRRRGPLRRRRNGEAGDAKPVEIKSEEPASADKAEYVQALEIETAAAPESDAQVDVAVENGVSEDIGDVSAAANE